MELEMTYARLAVPDCWNEAIAHGLSPTAALEKIMAGVPPLGDADDYERIVQGLRALHAPNVRCSCSTVPSEPAVVPLPPFQFPRCDDGEDACAGR